MSKKKPSPSNKPATEADTGSAAENAERGEQAGAEPVSDPTTAEQVPEAFAELREEADRLLLEVTEANDKYLRLAAELENTRRRAQSDLTEARKFAIKDFAEEVINVRDSLELAQAWEPGEGDSDATSMQEGLATTLKQLDQAFDKFAIQVVAPEPGDKLDPNLHQAMTTQESGEVAPNHVLSVIRKGYTLHDRLLRPAMVVVARAQVEAENTAEEPEDA